MRSTQKKSLGRLLPSASSKGRARSDPDPPDEESFDRRGSDLEYSIVNA